MQILGSSQTHSVSEAKPKHLGGLLTTDTDPPCPQLFSQDANQDCEGLWRAYNQPESSQSNHRPLYQQGRLADLLCDLRLIPCPLLDLFSYNANF
jgi:hypothetical protein